MNNDRFRFRAFCKWGMIYSDDDDYDLDVVGGVVWMDGCDDHVGHESFMQCTGLKDKNGVLIFEGDIVKWTYEITNGDFFGVIEYHIKKILNLDIDTNHIGFIVNGIDTRHGNYFTEFPLSSLYEVIGNIHENPEILEQ